MNHFSGIGRLTKDAVVRYSAGEDAKAVAKFTIAIDRVKKGEADFINCVAFGKTAEIVEKYTSKGKQIGIEGRVQSGSYEGKEGKVYYTEILVEKLELLGGKTEEKTEKPSGFEVLDDDIPF